MIELATGALVGIFIGSVVGGLIFGFVIGYTIVKKMVSKQMEENPPITEDQIRSMYAQMGRKPSEQQIRQIMNNFKRKNRENNR